MRYITKDLKKTKQNKTKTQLFIILTPYLSQLIKYWYVYGTSKVLSTLFHCCSKSYLLHFIFLPHLPIGSILSLMRNSSSSKLIRRHCSFTVNFTMLKDIYFSSCEVSLTDANIFKWHFWCVTITPIHFNTSKIGLRKKNQRMRR